MLRRKYVLCDKYEYEICGALVKELEKKKKERTGCFNKNS